MFVLLYDLKREEWIFNDFMLKMKMRCIPSFDNLLFPERDKMLYKQQQRYVPFMETVP